LSESLSKYKIAYDIGEVNELVEAGYKLHTALIDPQVHSTGYKTKYVMSLSSEKAYDNITNLQDIPPDMVDGYLAKGWIIADSWSKLVRMVKKQ